IVRTRPEGVASPRSPESFPAMCNLYSITTNQAAIAALFRIVVLTEGEVVMAKLAIIATIEVAPDRRDQLLPLLMAHRGRCLKDEPGTLQFEVLVPREDDTKVLLYEVYRDDAAFDVHLNGPHIERVREEAAGMI